MKITKQHIKQLVKEELANMLHERVKRSWVGWYKHNLASINEDLNKIIEIGDDRLMRPDARPHAAKVAEIVFKASTLLEPVLKALLALPAPDVTQSAAGTGWESGDSDT